MRGTGYAARRQRPRADSARQRAVVSAFLATSRAGDFDALRALLAPDAVVRADRAVASAGAPRAVQGAAAVAQLFAGRARGAHAALVNGAAALVWAPGGQPRVVFSFTVADGRVVAITMLAGLARLRQLNVVDLGDYVH